MADTTYVDYVAPAVNAEWLNEVNDHVWHDTPVSGNTVHGSDVIEFTPAGTGAALRTVKDKLLDYVDATDFMTGAEIADVRAGTVLVDVAAALQLALNTGKSVRIPSGTCYYGSSLNYTADGQCIYGLGNDSILKSGAGSVYINSAGFDNCSIRDLKLDGSGVGGTETNGGIVVNTDSQNFDVLNVYFYDGNQRVWLYECDHVTVQNCTFDSVGYGVIAQSGYASNHVLVDGNIALNMFGDFVEANQASVDSEMWTISNNVYSGNNAYPTGGTEDRFVGITRVRGIIITGNTIKNAGGDAPIHLEGALGETIISGNVFDNGLCTSGNTGYIYLLNSAENTIINGNIFLRTNAALADAYAVDVSSGSYTNSVQFTNNRVIGAGATSNFNGINLKANSGPFIISGNVFEDINAGISHNTSVAVTVCNNIFENCTTPIENPRTSVSSGGSDWLVTDNMFRSTAGANDIYVIQNTNGTGAPKRWIVQGNRFSKEVRITGQPGGVVGSSGDAEDIVISNNVFAATATLVTTGTMSRRVRFNNVFNGPTAGGGTTLIQDVPVYVDDTAAASGGIPLGGLYRNGSVLMVRVA